MKKSKAILGAAATLAVALGAFAFTSHNKKITPTVFRIEAGTCTLTDCVTVNDNAGKCDNSFVYFANLTDCLNGTNQIPTPWVAVD